MLKYVFQLQPVVSQSENLMGPIRIFLLSQKAEIEKDDWCSQTSEKIMSYNWLKIEVELIVLRLLPVVKVINYRL